MQQNDSHSHIHSHNHTHSNTATRTVAAHTITMEQQQQQQHTQSQEGQEQEALPRINPITSYSSFSFRIFKKMGMHILLFLSLVAVFAGSLLAVYSNLNDRITAATTVELNDNNQHTSRDFNITLELHNITDVSNEIFSIREDLKDQKDELLRLHNMIEFQLNTTFKALNDTVEQVQQSVEQQVQEVNDNVSSQNSLMAYQFAGTFAILGSLISLWHMTAHIRNFNEPTVQRKIIAIMWMIPIYSVSSWLGLVFVHAQAYLSIFKDIYEAYAIYTFLSFLIAILGRGDREAVITVLAQHADHLKAPMRFRIRPWAKRDPYASPRHKAEAVLDQCQFFTLQFVLLRPVTTIVIVICDAVHESRWDPKYPQFYVTMIVNISIFFAFTGLVRFYHVVKNDLNWCNPFSKFLCIKGVVFMTFWQGIVISFIAHAVYKNDNDDDHGDSDSSATEWSKQAQSFLVCLEMFFFAIVHCFVFPTEEWEPGYQEKAKRRIKANFGDSLALRDFVRDVKLVMRSRKRRGKMQKLPQRDYDGGVDGSGGGGSRVGRGGGNGSTLMEEEGGADLDESVDSIDINWSQGWGRIERYLEIVEEEQLAQEDGDMIEIEMQERHDPEEDDVRLQMQNDLNDLALTVDVDGDGEKGGEPPIPNATQIQHQPRSARDEEPSPREVV